MLKRRAIFTVPLRGGEKRSHSHSTGSGGLSAGQTGEGACRPCSPNQQTETAMQGRVRKMGSTGDPPVPVGDSPTGRARRSLPIRRSLSASGALPVPPGESPGDTGQSPELPISKFPGTLPDHAGQSACRHTNLRAVNGNWLQTIAFSLHKTELDRRQPVKKVAADVRRLSHRFFFRGNLSLVASTATGSGIFQRAA